MTDKAMSYSHLANVKFMEDLYTQYKSDAESVDPSWRNFFEGMEFGMTRGGQDKKISDSDLRIFLLIEHFRYRGHLYANYNPIAEKVGLMPAPSASSFGFSSDDLTKLFPTFGLLSKKEATLSEIIDRLKKIYCSSVGIEYPAEVGSEITKYMQSILESSSAASFTDSEKLSIFDDLSKAELFETFLHTRYVGQKRFSLEGAETLIPLLSFLFHEAIGQNIEHVVIGMAHRGRLNVLANILGKSYEEIFHEFEDHFSPELGQGTGDVKYHKGFEGSVSLPSGKKLSAFLCANPSHLEAVDPVVEGRAKGLQDEKRLGGKAVMPILIHGDASVAGQGVVYETLQLSQVEGYKTGGTIHIVINNQIGFTTLPKESRSTTYCTDIAKSFGAPVFHVNAEDPLACIGVARISLELRDRFGIDVFIDLCGYRKYGHNEGDEPSFTQPLLYEMIRSKKSIRTLYMQQLIQEGTLTLTAAEKIEEGLKLKLKNALDKIPPAKEDAPPHEEFYLVEKKIQADIPSISKELLINLSKQFCAVPNGMKLHPKVKRVFDDRLSAVLNDSAAAKIDWGAAEMLCFASLLHEGIDVRLSGQDCQRGTFSQRHAVWVDQVSGEKYCPLNHMQPKNGQITTLNSPLSEYAVMGFELGYSLARGRCLALWEAQYGDFANTAQVIIDQFISSLEQKWGQTSSLTLLLPHGYEGQGPEHSSARMERYLQLCAQGNMIIAVCSTPAQYFHLLRRQAYLKHKHPLIVFTPKALLRHPMCLSSLSDLTADSFKEVITDDAILEARKVIFCSGKIYYDLLQEREKRGASDIALIRIEQLYPFPKDLVKEQLQKYSKASHVVFAQEEHKNMGPWDYIEEMIRPLMTERKSLSYAGRARSAATATGSYYLHKKQQQQLMSEAFA